MNFKSLGETNLYFSHDFWNALYKGGHIDHQDFLYWAVYWDQYGWEQRNNRLGLIVKLHLQFLEYFIMKLILCHLLEQKFINQ